MSISQSITEATDQVCRALEGLAFAPPVTHLYNPLRYARRPHQTYIDRFARARKRVLFMGMNPGPWGMAQTGVPFGEIAAVRDWMGINEPVDKPEREHPKRPIEGFRCAKSEVSGRRLWGLFSRLYPDAADFFREHYVVNYCPLVWMEESGRNRTPDKLPAAELEPVHAVCDEYLRRHLEALEPECVVGVGSYAENCLMRVSRSLGRDLRVGRILHPSPASPAANRDWEGTAEKQLVELGIGP